MKINKRIVFAIAAVVIIVLGAAFVLWFRGPRGYLGKRESITVAYPSFESATLFYIAEDQHFFSRNGLNVTSRKYDSGVASLGGIINGEADIALGMAEFPLVGRAFEKEKILKTSFPFPLSVCSL